MNVLQIILVIAGGVVTGGTTAALVQGVFGRKSARANAAQAVGEVAHTVSEMYLSLQKELMEVKAAVTLLTNKIDDLLPVMTGISPEERQELREINRQVKIVA